MRVPTGLERFRHAQVEEIHPVVAELTALGHLHVLRHLRQPGHHRCRHHVGALLRQAGRRAERARQAHVGRHRVAEAGADLVRRVEADVALVVDADVRVVPVARVLVAVVVADRDAAEQGHIVEARVELRFEPVVPLRHLGDRREEVAHLPARGRVLVVDGHRLVRERVGDGDRRVVLRLHRVVHRRVEIPELAAEVREHDRRAAADLPLHRGGVFPLVRALQVRVDDSRGSAGGSRCIAQRRSRFLARAGRRRRRPRGRSGRRCSCR